MTARRILPGELLAVDSGAIHRGADGFFFMTGPESPKSSRHATYSDVAIVHVRGTLEHHSTFGSESYEDTLCRITEAMSGVDCCEEGAQPVKPSAVIMCIDSKGGVVAGLNETVAAIQKARKASGVPLIAYVNELAASAAFALTCPCDATYCPESAILGSIGTISTMVSCVEADQKAGLDVRLITSGARKADGHPHTPISDAAEEAERERVEGAAAAFFKLAGKARGLSPSKLEGYQAALFVGSQAVKAGLADDVMSLDDLALAYSSTSKAGGVAAKGNETQRRATAAQVGTTSLDSCAIARSTLANAEPAMNPKLEALIKKTEARLELATDPKKKARIAADLASFRMTALRADSDSDDDSDDDDDDSDDDSKSKKAAAAAEKAKRAAEAGKHKARAAEFRKKAAEADEEAQKAEAEDDEEEEEDSAKKAALPAGAIAALAGQSDIAASNAEAIAKMQARLDASDRTAIVESAFSGRRITPAERKTLLGKPLAFVQDFLAMRPKAIVQAAGDEIQVPPMSGSSPITESMRADLAAEVAKLQAMGSKITIESASAALEKSLNGKAPVV